MRSYSTAITAIVQGDFVILGRQVDFICVLQIMITLFYKS